MADVASASQGPQELTHEELIQEWESWASPATEGEWRADAVEKLKKSLDEGVISLDLQGLCLTSLPPNLPPLITQLDVSFNQLTALPDNLPTGLTDLDVNNNQLRALPDNLPTGLTQLDVSFNQLTALPDNLPTGLTELWVNGNRLTALPDILPIGLTKLWVNGNHLAALPDNLPTELTELWVNGNRLTALPDILPIGLTTLRAEGNQLTVLPNNLPTGLTELDVNNNQLTALPDILPIGLTTLRAKGNQLTALPNNLPRGLTELWVNGNRLTALPDILPIGLTKLWVNGNRLTALPDILPIGLTKLWVGSNQLTGLPDNLPENLALLDVDGNQLTALPNNLPRGLTVLGADGNQLIELPDNLPIDLERLYVMHNQLTALPNSIINLSSCIIFLEGNPFPHSVLESLQSATRAQGYQGPTIYFSMYRPSTTATRPLQHALADWCPDSSGTEEQQAWAGFAKEENASEFSVFLDRLKGTIVYAKPALKAKAAQWLNTLAAKQSLRALTFAIAHDASRSCDDRVLLSYNSMQKTMLQDAAQNGEYDNDLRALIGLARGLFRLDALETIARKKASTLHFVDEIEVYLAYQVKLHKALHLPVDVDDMLFYGVSGVTQADLSQAEADVKKLEADNFLPHLVSWGPWEGMLGRLAGADYEADKHQFLETMNDQIGAALEKQQDNFGITLSPGERVKAAAGFGKILEIEMKVEFTKQFLAERGLSDVLKPQAAAPSTLSG